MTNFIEAALAKMAGNNEDMCREKNFLGFNRPHSRFGAFLASFPILPDSFLGNAFKILTTYKNTQLYEEWADIEAEYKDRIAKAVIVPNTTAACCKLEEGMIEMRFRYDPATIQQVKDKIAGRRYNPLTKSWNAPDSAANRAAVKDIFGEDLQGEIQKMKVFVCAKDNTFIFSCQGFSKEFNAIFSNKESTLAGIAYYNPEDHSRTVFDQKTAIAAVQILSQNFNVVIHSSFEEAMAKEVEIPHLKEILNEGIIPFRHQLEGIQFLLNSNGSNILGDEMGLGKTFQALAYGILNNFKTLVIAPKVVVKNWAEEVSKFFNCVSKKDILPLYSKIAKKYPTLPTNIKIVSMNYEAIDKFPNLSNEGFDLLIVDECHMIKNVHTKRYQSLANLAEVIPHKILLSGTVAKNKRTDAWSQINLVNPSIFKDSDAIRETTYGQFRKMISEFYLVRTKAQCLDLPPKILTLIKAPTEHPIPMAESFEECQKQRVALANAKVESTLDFWNNWLESSNKEDKIVIYSEFVESISQIHDEINTQLPGGSVLHHGRLTDNQREKALKEFKENPAVRVLCTTRPSMAVGFNLQIASTAIFNDLPWTIADIVQSEDRLHRIGQSQKHSVNIYWIVQSSLYSIDQFNKKSPMDESICEILKRKLEIHRKQNQGFKITDVERAALESPLSFEDLR